MFRCLAGNGSEIFSTRISCLYLELSTLGCFQCCSTKLFLVVQVCVFDDGSLFGSFVLKVVTGHFPNELANSKCMENLRVLQTENNKNNKNEGITYLCNDICVFYNALQLKAGL